MSDEIDTDFGEIAVLGPGLIGGSLIRAIQAKMPRVRLRAWARREDAAEELVLSGFVQEASTDPAKVVEGVDLAILAMPTGAMEEVVRRVTSFREGKETLVTDVGSVKGAVMSGIAPLVRQKGGRFVGSHPMAGSEKSGMEHACADLFSDAAVILTPDDHTTKLDLDRLIAFWSALGCRIIPMSAFEHDGIVAGISHLPHLAAAALVRSVLGEAPEVARFSGGGFRDTTRVASGPEAMWAGILCDNREAVLQRLAKLIVELETWKEALAALDRERLQSFLSEARQLRETL